MANVWHQHPHHTFQSWRDRWAKKLSKLPRPNLADAELPVPANDPPRLRQSPRRVPRKSQDGHSESVARVPFTEEDDKLLLKYVAEIRAANEPVRGNKIYEALAEEVSLSLRILRRRLTDSSFRIILINRGVIAT